MSGLHRKTDIVKPDVIPSVGQTSMTNVATVALGAIAGVIVARTLGPHGRGVYAISTVAPTFIGIVGTLGVEEAIVYVAGRTDDHQAIGRLIWGSGALAIVLGSIASVVSILFQLVLFWRPSLGVSEFLFIAMACQPLQFTISQAMLAHLRAQARYSIWNTLRILVSLVYLAGLVVALWLGELTVDTAILCLITGNVTVLLASVFSVCLGHRPSTSREDIKSVFSYGWKNHLVTVQTYANQQLDQVFLAAMVPVAQLGQYAIAVTYASAGLSLGLAPALQIYSHFSRKHQPDRAAYRRLLIRTLILLTCTSVVSGALAPIVIPLVFGKAYEMAVEPALILVLGSPVLSLSAMYSAIWKSAGKPLTAAKAQGIGLLLTIISLPIAIIYLGIIGAALVSIVAYGVVAIWLWHSKPFDGLLVARRPIEPSREVIDDPLVSSDRSSSDNNWQEVSET
jgi:O-antigen/teichoic acid export membrane protein